MPEETENGRTVLMINEYCLLLEAGNFNSLMFLTSLVPKKECVNSTDLL